MCEHWNENAGCSSEVHKRWTHFFLLISYLCNHADYAMILAKFAKHFPNSPITCYWNVTILFCKFKETGSVLRMCHNLGGFVWRQCGRIWKIGLPLRWKMRTPISTCHISAVLMLNRFGKCSNAWSSTFINPVLFLITLFNFRFTHFFLFFSHVPITLYNYDTCYCDCSRSNDLLWIWSYAITVGSEKFRFWTLSNQVSFEWGRRVFFFVRFSFFFFFFCNKIHAFRNEELICKIIRTITASE